MLRLMILILSPMAWSVASDDSGVESEDFNASSYVSLNFRLISNLGNSSDGPSVWFRLMFHL